MKNKIKYSALIAAVFFTFYSRCLAQTSPDTLRVMEYNVLGFGNYNPNNCQATTPAELPPLYADLRAIIQFANPDIIGLDKLQSIDTGSLDLSQLSSYTFPDTVISECFDANFPGRYAYCPFTGYSRGLDGSSSLLIYDQTKLVYVSTTPMYYGEEDIDMYKLYYKQAWFSGSSDTTFLYVIIGHDQDNGKTDPSNNGQDSIIMNKVRAMFTHTPNLIYMGDFNTRESDEPGYAYITQTTDTNYIMDDPPFHPDAHLSYPDIWHSGSASQAYFTTTTRETTLPNLCGTTGGGKDWYDHIFLSPWLIKGNNNLTYVKNSYRTIGNDGNRAGISVNSGTNTSAPAGVINALFNFSDKYPVEVTLAVNPALGIKNILSQPGSIKVNNPVENNLIMHFASFLNGQNITMEIYDICGRALCQTTLNVNSSVISKSVSLAPGVYMLHFVAGQYSTTLKVVKE